MAPDEQRRGTVLLGVLAHLRGRRVALRYGLTVAGTLGAFALRLGFPEVFGPPYILFYPTVMLVAVLAGLGPGLLSTALSAVLTATWILPAGLRSARDVVGLGIFTSMGLLMSLVAHRYRSATQRLADLRLAAEAEESAEQLRASEEGLRQARDAAALSAAQLEAVLQAMSDGVVIFDASGAVVFVNEAEARINGYPSAADMKRDLAYFAEVYVLEEPGGPVVPVEAWPASCVLRGEVVVERELRGRRRDTGQSWTFSFSGGPVRDRHGRQLLSVVITRDISDQRRAEAQARQAQKMETIGRLAGGVAHDFNNLLIGILGYAELLEEGIRAGRPSLEDLAEIRKGGERARDLTAQLLAVARRQVSEPRPVEVGEVIRDAEKLLRRLVGEDVDIHLDLPGGLGTVHADPAQLQQVIMNLAVNARDAMPRGGRLTIETSAVLLDERYAGQHAEVEPGRYLMIAVSDSGEGMSAEVRSQLFEPFFTTKALGRGTGLGLATVHGIVRQAGGHVWVYSEPGQGTTFKIYLPLRDDPPAPARAPAAGPSRGGRESLLLVEDDAVVRALALRVLRGAGYQVHEAANGHEALALAVRAPARPALLLTDVVMPGMSGKQLADTLRGERPDLRVLYVSGYTQNTIVHHGVLDSGINFLPKPYTPSALLARVREVLDER